MRSVMLSSSCAALAFAAAALPSLASAQSPPDPAHACGSLIRAAHQDGYARAIDVYNCWVTVPFNSAVATRFNRYINDTLQFQGTLEYLKQPPQGYQQPPVDLIAGINAIQHDIDTNAFANEYQFEAAVQSLLFSAHDAHVSLNAGLLSPFYFGSSYGLKSVSIDGIQEPKVYLTDDLVYNQTNTDPSWQISAISQINGTDVLDYLTRFAALNSYGTLEPHADYNLLFDSPVIDVLADFFPLWHGGATFYPGDNFTYTFEDGSTFDNEWLATYFDPGETGPLETGGDYYNFFVLGFYPASYIPPSADAQASASPAVNTSITRLNNTAYPQPDVWQANLTVNGYTTGYFLHEQSLAVLSIPTFFADEASIGAFIRTVSDFLAGAKAAGLAKVVIDLQQNEGGDILLAYAVFKQFFPSIEAFAGSNMRENSLGNLMGSIITAYYDLQDDSSHAHQQASADEWIATTRINAATGHNFTDWKELFAGSLDPIDLLSATIRLNISNYLYDYSALGQVEPPSVLLSPSSGNAPYSAEDIIMLSDGLCASACSLFMEMMYWDAGVKNVVVGGRPTFGPMQTPSGSRGARYYDVIELDADVNNTIAVELQNDLDVDAILPDRTNQDIYILDAGVDLRNQVREGETVPLQMKYEAADCRIFYTPATSNNFTRLWGYAADAMWTDTSRCVQGSTGFATSKGTTPKPAPPAAPLTAVNYNSIGVPTLLHSDSDTRISVFDQPLPDGAQPSDSFVRQGGGSSHLQQSNPQYLKQNQQSTGIRQASDRGKSLPQRGVASRNAPPSRGHRRARRVVASRQSGSKTNATPRRRR